MAEVYNEDVLRIHSRINRYIEEMQKSVSANVSEMNKFDMGRVRAYLSALRFLHDSVQAMPEIDQPEVHPKAYAMRPNPAVIVVENENVNDLVNMMINMRDELANSQSARRGARLISFDSVRFLDAIGRMEQFLTSYVEKATPLDLPESSPRSEMSGPGRVGVGSGQ